MMIIDENMFFFSLATTKRTFNRDDCFSKFTSDKLVRDDLYLRPNRIQTRAVITSIR